MENEEEKFHLIKTELLAHRKVFEDPEFQATYKNISHDKSVSYSCCWIRPILMFENLNFIKNENFEMISYPGKVDNIGIPAAVESLKSCPALWSRVVPRDENISGGYVGMNLFRFWNFGKWISILIDDRLPFDLKEQKFLFTSTGLPQECWKPLLEKAYAKTLGAYWALEKINILEFLEDISGGVTEYFNVKECTQGMLEAVLKLAVKKKSIIICCTSIGPDETGERPDIKGSNYFSISTVRPASYKGKNYTLIRIKKLFGSFSEEKNIFRHTMDPKLVKSKTLDRQLQGESVPGEFWMTYKDFTVHIDHLFVCNLSHDINLHHQHWELAIYHGWWCKNISAGGPSLDYACFLTNPQFRILIRGEEDEMPVIVSLSQRRISCLDKKNNFNKFKRFLPIGFTVYKVNMPNTNLLDYRFLSQHSPIYQAKYFERREVCVRLVVPKGNYVIIPSTAKPNIEGEFLLRVMTTHKSFLDIPWVPKTESTDNFMGPCITEKKSSKCSIHLELLPRIVAGLPFEIRLKVYTDFEFDVPISIFIACNCITTTGRGHRTIKGKEITVYLEKGKTYETTLLINFFDYARKRLHEYLFSAMCAIYEQGGQVIVFETKDFFLDLPELFIGYSQSEENECKFPVESWFVNPLPCAIEYALFLVESPQMKAQPAIVETGPIGPMSRAVAQFDIIPHTPGRYSVIVRFISKVFNLKTSLSLNIYEPEVEGEEEVKEEEVEFENEEIMEEEFIGEYEPTEIEIFEETYEEEINEEEPQFVEDSEINEVINENVMEETEEKSIQNLKEKSEIEEVASEDEAYIKSETILIQESEPEIENE